MRPNEEMTMILKTDSTQNTLSLTSKPLPDNSAIMSALQTLFSPGDVVELRAFGSGGRKQVNAGYFDSDHWELLAEQAAALSSREAAVYITLNPVEPQLLSRYSNRIEPYAAKLTTDSQILRRRWLLIDLDPVRPSGTSATPLQLSAARIMALDVNGYLHRLGWPMPIIAESGNGYHLVYSIDLPNDESSTALVKAVLTTLADRFDDAMTKVDQAVFNASRVCKLYGTVANKGDHTETMPWRLSKILHSPKRINVTAEQLKSALPVSPASLSPEKVIHKVNQAIQPTAGVFNLEEFLERNNLGFQVDLHNGRERFKLSNCPFNPEHISGEAAVFRYASGMLGFKCQHDSCSTKTWRDVREHLDGPRANKVASMSASKPTIAPAGDATKTMLNEWPDPTPLPNSLPPVDAFCADLLPLELRGWVMDIAHRMQCPPDFPAITALIAASSLIGSRAVVRPKVRDDWQVVPNLWGIAVGRPGVKKSPALSEALKPLSRLQANAFDELKSAHAAWELDAEVAAMQKDSNQKKAKSLAEKNPFAARALLAPIDIPEEPYARRFIVNDATVEKLGELLQQNPGGILTYRDEIYSLLVSLDKQGQEESRGFYLQSYDGDKSYTFERISRGTVHIPRVCLSMVGGIQPGRIQEYVRGAVAGGSADDGLLQRFGLAVWPDLAEEFVHVDKWPDADAKQTAWAVFDRLSVLQPASENEPVVWRFDEAAQALFVEWLVPFEAEIRGDTLHPAMVSHLSKYRKLIPSLALVFASIDTPDNDGVIGVAELTRALAWGKYLRSHAHRLYAAAVIPETVNSATLLSRIKTGKLTGSDGVALNAFTPRQVALKHWAGLGTPDAVRKAADVLVDYDWLRRETVTPGTSGGRPSERYLIHPRLVTNPSS
jgi:hypothetical protein